MSAIPYMPLYVADYLADAAHLSTEEHGAYLLLIMNYWQRGKPLPAEPERLARIARLSNERWTDVERTLNEFFTVVDGGWRHKRIDAELEKVFAKSTKASAAGKASARAKSTKPPTYVQQTFNERSTDVEQTFNHTDTDTDIIRLDSAGEVLPDPVKAKPADQFAILEKQLREAAGWEREPHPNLSVIGPIATVLTLGVDLELDLLPAAKAHGPRLSSRTSWKYILQAAISNRDARLGATADASKPTTQPARAGTFHANTPKPNSIAHSFAVVDAAIEAERERIERGWREIEAGGNGAGIGDESLRLVS